MGARCSLPSVEEAARTVSAVIRCGVPVARIELPGALQVRDVDACADPAPPEAALLRPGFAAAWRRSPGRPGRWGR